jgi:hypothetical protein
VAERIGSKIKIAGWWGGAATRRDNGVIENVQAMKNAGYFDRPGYFKWDDQPVVSGYCDGADPSNNFNYWVTAKQQFPEIMFWINGWHPNYWNPIVEGYVDGAFVFNPSAPAKNAEESQVNYYDLCNQIGLKIHIFTATPGFDNTIWNEKLGWTLKKLDRRNGDTYRECWDAIKDLEPQPDVIMVLTWNDWWEIDGIEHISVSRSTTTDAFGDLYLRLTKQYGSIWKREAPSIPPIIPIIAIIVICVIIGGGVIVVSHPR